MKCERCQKEAENLQEITFQTWDRNNQSFKESTRVYCLPCVKWVMPYTTVKSVRPYGSQEGK